MLGYQTVITEVINSSERQASFPYLGTGPGIVTPLCNDDGALSPSNYSLSWSKTEARVLSVPTTRFAILYK